MRPPIISGVRVAGPSVQTIFARRIRQTVARKALIPSGASGYLGDGMDSFRSVGTTVLVAGTAWGTACTVQRDAPNLKGQDIRVTVLHTSDIHSRLFPYRFVP